jgi:nicotinate-nucleotide adenylyltransferase
MASAEDRAHMVDLAIEGYPGFELSRFELSRPGKSYTVDTLRDFRYEIGCDIALFLIIGADNAVEMGDWCKPEEVLELAQVLVVERPGFPRDRIQALYQSKMQFVETPLLDIASTTIRHRVRAGKPIRFFVPDPVVEYIEAQALYC